MATEVHGIKHELNGAAELQAADGHSLPGSANIRSAIIRLGHLIERRNLKLKNQMSQSLQVPVIAVLDRRHSALRN
jgi:hypothetical protein